MIKNIVTMPWDDYNKLRELILCLMGEGNDHTYSRRIACQMFELLEE